MNRGRARVAHDGQRATNAFARPLREVHALTWMADAACAGMDTNLFFPAGTGHGRPAGYGVEAKAVCHRCPVRIECLNHALANGEQHGIWGGMGPRERTNVRRRRAVAS